jgi:nitrite reductase (NADH) small subunit
VATVEELRAAKRLVVDLGGRSIVVLSVGDRFYAVRDRCPHRGAALCEGTVNGTFVASSPQEYRYGMDESVVRCPWHGWEFDLDTGRSLLEPDAVRVRVFRTSVQDGTVVVHV